MVAAEPEGFICGSGQLLERGRGVRFTVQRQGSVTPAFVIRFEGQVHAYLNVCSHRSLELDWNEGEFFAVFGDELLCATHGARYAPASGHCVGGPCRRAGLVKLAVVEIDGGIYLDSKDDVHLAKQKE
ncbi:MAG: Rieske (2Fe-2S) protein [Gammaproteobacteria bacterium]|nr:Rieske (2Fe-2S) protein [Gammaproteobacteria bacterium]